MLGSDYSQGLNAGLMNLLNAYQTSKKGAQDQAMQEQELALRKQGLLNEQQARNQQGLLVAKEKGLIPIKDEQGNITDYQQDPALKAESQANKQFELTNKTATTLKSLKDAGFDAEIDPNTKAVVNIKKAKNLSLADQKTMAEIAKLNKETNTEKQGKTIASTEIANFGNADSANSSLNDIGQLIEANKDKFGPVAGRVGLLKNSFGGDNRTGTVNAILNQAAQKVGVYLEGGKLAEGDIKRYREMLPVITDPPELANNKLQALQRMISTKKASDLQNYQQAGYNVGSVGQLNTPALPLGGKKTLGNALAATPFSSMVNNAVAGEAPKPKTITQKGHTYTLNPQTGQYE